jgi:hypothetical protein
VKKKHVLAWVLLILGEAALAVPSAVAGDPAPSSPGIAGWTRCDSSPVPSVRKVAFTDLRSLLPPDTPFVTPAQREAMIRERNSALQQRALW